MQEHEHPYGASLFMLLSAAGFFAVLISFFAPHAGTISQQASVSESVAPDSWVVPINMHRSYSFDGRNALQGKTGVEKIKGVRGSGLSFDGIRDVAHLGNLGLTNNKIFAVSIWYRSHGGEGWIFAEGSMTDNIPLCGVAVKGGALESFCRTGTDQERKSVFRGGTRMNDGRWHHVVFQGTGSVIELYVDGGLEGRTQVPAGYVYTDASALGALPQAESEGWIKMDVDELVVYDRALTQDEILQLFAGAQQ